MNKYDDFDTQVTPEELAWERDFLEWYYSEENLSERVYKVQDSDDLIYEWVE